MNAKIKTPIVPNFVRVDVAGDIRSISVGMLTDEDIEQIAKDWKLELYAHRDRLKNGPRRSEFK